MSVAAIASLRPLQGRCIRHATPGLLSVRVQLASATLTLRAVVSLPQRQRRFQSQSSTPGNQNQPPKQAKPPATFRQFMGRALGASLRNVAVAISPRGIRSAYKDAPALTSMNIILWAVFLSFLPSRFGNYKYALSPFMMFALLIWAPTHRLALLAVISAIAIRSYLLTFYNSEFSRYPEPVANTLRRAIYYTNYKPDPEMALKYYKMAMEQVAQIGLDPFSDEVLGIRIQVACWLEKINSYKASIDVLESVLQDCKKWISAMEQSASEGKITAAASKNDGAARAADGNKVGSGTEPDVEVETPWRKRQRLLAKAVGTAVKLGELYADEHVLEPEKSHEHLVWAVETSLEEFRRRAGEGIKPGEQAWLSATELGGMMESLGRLYERRSQFQLAVPLFFQALKVCESPCHRAVIMNNLAACFAQHPVPDTNTAEAEAELSESIRSLPGQSALPKTRTECLEAGLNWAQNAHAHGRDVKGEARTAECDEACAAALCNWADVAAMMGKTELAQQKYKQCIDMSEKLGFPDGVEQARRGLARLAATTQSKK